MNNFIAYLFRKITLQLLYIEIIYNLYIILSNFTPYLYFFTFDIDKNVVKYKL